MTVDRRTGVRVGGSGEDLVKRSGFVRTRDEEIGVGGLVEYRKGECQPQGRIGGGRHRQYPAYRLCQRG